MLTVTTDGSEGVLHGTSGRARLPLGLGLAALVLGGLALGQDLARAVARRFNGKQAANTTPAEQSGDSLSSSATT